MPGVDPRNLIGGIRRDQEIYRIYPLKWFLELLVSGRDGLRSPSAWDDPFENFFLSRTKVDFGGGDIGTLSNLADAWYGQCWTKNFDTDAMWRIYSPNKEGVQVKTTVGKLFDNLCTVSVWSPSLQFFVGQVDYVSEDEIKTMMKGLTLLDITSGGRGDGFAQLLCIKRKAFHHEQEVRIMYHSLKDVVGPKGVDRTVHYPLNANAVFDEVLLDPRLTDTEAKAIAAGLLALGWNKDAPRSKLYETPEFMIPAM